MENTLKILFVDDQEDVREETRDVFRRFDFQDYNVELLEAGSATEAIEILQEDDADSPEIGLIFLDIVMEEGNNAGFLVLDFLHETKHNFITQIHIYTGQAGDLAPTKEEMKELYDVREVFIKSDNNSSNHIIQNQAKLALKTFINLRDFVAQAHLNEQRISRFMLTLYRPILHKQSQPQSNEEYSKFVEDLIEVISQEKGKSVQPVDQDALNALCDIRYKGFKYLVYLINELINQKISGNISKQRVVEKMESIDAFHEYKPGSGIKWISSCRELVVLYLALTGFKVDEKQSTCFEYLSADEHNFYDFFTHFNGYSADPKLNWKGQQRELILLLTNLVEQKKYLDNPFKNSYQSIIESHFKLDDKDIELLDKDDRAKQKMSLRVSVCDIKKRMKNDPDYPQSFPVTAQVINTIKRIDYKNAGNLFAMNRDKEKFTDVYKDCLVSLHRLPEGKEEAEKLIGLYKLETEWYEFYKMVNQSIE